MQVSTLEASSPFVSSHEKLLSNILFVGHKSDPVMQTNCCGNFECEVGEEACSDCSGFILAVRTAGNRYLLDLHTVTHAYTH